MSQQHAPQPENVNWYEASQSMPFAAISGKRCLTCRTVNLPQAQFCTGCELSLADGELIFQVSKAVPSASPGVQSVPGTPAQPAISEPVVQPRKNEDIFEIVAGEKWSTIPKNRKTFIYISAGVTAFILFLALLADTFWIWFFLLFLTWVGILMIYPRAKKAYDEQQNQAARSVTQTPVATPQTSHQQQSFATPPVVIAPTPSQVQITPPPAQTPILQEPGTPTISLPESREVVPVAKPALSLKEVQLSAFGKDIQTGEIVALPQTARRQGLYIIGANGTGKSTLIANLIVQDMEQGIGVCLLDPHGDLTTQVLARVPDKRIEDVILLDLMDSGYPFGLNLFECPSPDDLEQVALTASFVMHVFAKVWNVGTETPLLAQVLRNVTFALIQNPGTTLAEIPLLLADETCRNKLVANVKNAQVRLFWTQYGKLKQHDQMERTSSTLNKVDAFLTQPIIANIVSQSHTTLDFRDIMDSGKILLVQLNPRLEDISSLVGSVVIGQLLNAALSRKDIPEEKRRQFHLYADEYQRYATEDFATLLSEARKFGVATTIAHQTRSQLDYANKGVTVNAANIIVFRVTGEDAGELAKEFDATPPPPEVIGKRPVLVPKQDAIRHLLEQGHPNHKAMAFQSYLQTLIEWTGERLIAPHSISGGGIVGGAIAFARNAHAVHKFEQARQLQQESKMMVHNLNAWFYAGMLAHERPEIKPRVTAGGSVLETLPHEILLTAAQVFYFDRFLRPYQHPREIQLLCSYKIQDWDEAMSTLVKPGNTDHEQQRARCLDFLNMLWLTFTTLVAEPILVDSGRWEDIYDKPRTYADVQNEIATRLANLKNYTAKVKTVGQPEHTIQTLLPNKGVAGVEFDMRRADILTQTRLGYCRPRSEVEQEIIDRQEKLIKKADEQPKRFE